MSGEVRATLNKPCLATCVGSGFMNQFGSYLSIFGIRAAQSDYSGEFAQMRFSALPAKVSLDFPLISPLRRSRALHSVQDNPREYDVELCYRRVRRADFCKGRKD